MSWKYYLIGTGSLAWSLKAVLCQKVNAKNPEQPGSSESDNKNNSEKEFRILEYSDVLKRGHNARRHSHGYWVGIDTKDLHASFTDPVFATNLPKFFQAEPEVRSVIDVGCGNGSYAQALADAGLLVNCYDGNPATQEVSGGRCGVLDFSRPVNLLFKYDWVLSLKVGKHIPAKYQDNFINNLDSLNTKGILICWGGNTQEVGGQKHFNHKTDEEIVKIFENKGYVHDLEAERLLRLKASNFALKGRLLIFRKVNSEVSNGKRVL